MNLCVIAKCVAKLKPAITMKTIATPSMAGESKKPKLASWLLKPPSARVVMACTTASIKSMPAIQ